VVQYWAVTQLALYFTPTFAFTPLTITNLAHSKRPQSNGIPNIQADAPGAYL